MLKLLLFVAAAIPMAAVDSTVDPNGALEPVSDSAPLTTTPLTTALLTTAYVSSVRVLDTYPHCSSSPCTSFTEGLAFNAAGELFESAGGYGAMQPSVRQVDLATGGAVGATMPQINGVFAEGLTVLPNDNSRLLQLTYREDLVNEYSRKDGKLEFVGSMPVKLGVEGWGLAHSPDGSLLYLTDSTDQLLHVNTSSLEVLRSVPIVDARLDGGAGRHIYGVNELELVGEEVWGNVYPTCGAVPAVQPTSLVQPTWGRMWGRTWGRMWGMWGRKMHTSGAGSGARKLCDHSECIVRIDPASGSVLGWVDATALLEREPAATRADSMSSVFNGIAHHRESGKLFVTGKNWESIYSVAVDPTEHDASHVESVCRLARE